MVDEDLVGVLGAPRRRRNHGRAEQLTRYIHKYDCEDIMEYAVDVYDWKKSLEVHYQIGDWPYIQYEEGFKDIFQLTCIAKQLQLGQ